MSEKINNLIRRPRVVQPEPVNQPQAIEQPQAPVQQPAPVVQQQAPVQPQPQVQQPEPVIQQPQAPIEQPQPVVQPQPQVQQPQPVVQQPAPIEQPQPIVQPEPAYQPPSKVLRYALYGVGALVTLGITYAGVTFFGPMLDKKKVDASPAPVVAPTVPSKSTLAKEGLEHCSRTELKLLDSSKVFDTYTLPSGLAPACQTWAQGQVDKYKPKEVETLAPSSSSPLASAPTPSLKSMTFADVQTSFRTACGLDSHKFVKDEAMFFSQDLNPTIFFLMDTSSLKLAPQCDTFLKSGRYINIVPASAPVVQEPPKPVEVAPTPKPVSPPPQPKPVAKPKKPQQEICFSCDAEKFMNN